MSPPHGGLPYVNLQYMQIHHCHKRFIRCHALLKQVPLIQRRISGYTVPMMQKLWSKFAGSVLRQSRSPPFVALNSWNSPPRVWHSLSGMHRSPKFGRSCTGRYWHAPASDTVLRCLSGLRIRSQNSYHQHQRKSSLNGHREALARHPHLFEIRPALRLLIHVIHKMLR